MVSMRARGTGAPAWKLRDARARSRGLTHADRTAEEWARPGVQAAQPDRARPQLLPRRAHERYRWPPRCRFQRLRGSRPNTGPLSASNNSSPATIVVSLASIHNEPLYDPLAVLLSLAVAYKNTLYSYKLNQIILSCKIKLCDSQFLISHSHFVLYCPV